MSWLKRNKKKITWTIVLLFALMNIVAACHAYKFTHFSTEAAAKTKKPEKLSFGEKLSALAFGVSNPRPTNKTLPKSKYETLKLKSNKEIECWYIPADSAIGTVIMFHGYSSEKSGLLKRSEVFAKTRYSILLVDFMGSGGSEGNQTTIGYKEAEEVKTAFDFIKEKGEKNIVLCGASMGAVALMKAIDDYKIEPSSIIIECPFGTMYETVCARFHNMNVPTFPMAGLLVFWGGVENGFWAFGHKPKEYAKKITCPVLLLYGEKDVNVSRKEIDEIYANLPKEKTLKTYANGGHDILLNGYKAEWEKDVADFLSASPD